MDKHQGQSFNSILFCGCSHVYGTDLEDYYRHINGMEPIDNYWNVGEHQSSHRYSRLLANRYGAMEYNISEPGGSNDHIAAKVVEFVNKNFSPDLAIIQLTYPTRFLAYDDYHRTWQNVMPSHMGYLPKELNEAKDLFYKYVYHDRMAVMHYWRNAYLLQEMFRAKGIEYFFFRTCNVPHLEDDLYYPYIDQTRFFKQSMQEDLSKGLHETFCVPKVKGVTVGCHLNEMGHRKVYKYILNSIEHFYTHGFQRLS